MFAYQLMSLVSGSLFTIGTIIGIFVLIFYLKQRQGQSEGSIPPLDLVDAKKLDDMVAKQVEGFLAPLLSSKGYTEDQIKEILVRTSKQNQPFRR